MTITNTDILENSPISFPGLFGDWEFTADSVALHNGHGIYWYGIILGLGVLFGMLLCLRQAKHYGIQEDNLLDLVLLGVPLGILGARTYYVLFYLDRFRNADGSLNWGSVVAVWDGGLAIYGTVIAVFLMAFLYCRRKGIRLGAMTDLCVMGLMLGQAIGRWGNYANMEAYGAPVTAAWAQFFPLAVEIPTVLADGTTAYVWHMATFFYESLWCALLFVFLYRLQRKARHCGNVFFAYLVLYCAERAVVEGLREDSLMLRLFGLSIRFSQLLSALVIVFVAVVFFRRLRRAKKPRTADFMAWGALALSLVCCCLSEFERNGRPALFVAAQAFVWAMLALDAAFIAHYARNMRRADRQLLCACAAALLAFITTVSGLSRPSSIAFSTLRQTAAIAHAALAAGWFAVRAEG